MRTAFKVVLIVAIVLFLLNLFFNGLAIASGHNIPQETLNTLRNWQIALIVSIIGSSVAIWKIKKN